ncbi:MAG: hypothetical protein JSW11_02965 [Candidatus Heimdallarchaeota archaeon]|nr:MAG: hypothetical protein JSW11_02965 [Candidatus Heimdallarchaeota archaeon]
MIWNFHIAIELLLGFLTLILSAYGAYVAYKIMISQNEENSQTPEKEKENFYYLLSMISVILLVSRSLNVFYFYYVLVSLVPIIPGSMCPYGVLDASLPSIGFLDLIIKFIVPFAYGAWLILDHINKKTRKLVLTAFLSKLYVFGMFPLLLIDSGLDWIYFWFLEPIEVNCCRNVLNEAFSYNPIQILGPETALISFLFTMALLLIIIILQLFQDHNPLFLFGSLLLAILAVPFFLIAIQEFIAPVWITTSKDLLKQPLGEPHHCPFCLVKRWWTMIPYLLLIWLGLASVGWEAIIRGVTKKNIEIKEETQPILRYLRLTSLISLISGFIILSGHFAFFIVIDLI